MPSSRRSDDRPTRDREDRPASRPPRRDVEREVMSLRESGRSFAAIASSLGLRRSVDAHAAFMRGVRAVPEADRGDLVARENERLDHLETRIRTRDVAQPVKMARRLEALQALRDQLR